jgi:hypothetical protein
MKFGIESSLQKLTSKQEFRKNPLIDGRNLIKCVNKYVCLYFPRLLLNLCEIGCRICLQKHTEYV